MAAETGDVTSKPNTCRWLPCYWNLMRWSRYILLSTQDQAYRAALEIMMKQIHTWRYMASMKSTVDEVRKSLEFTQGEVDDLRSEVKKLEKEKAADKKDYLLYRAWEDNNVRRQVKTVKFWKTAVTTFKIIVEETTCILLEWRRDLAERHGSRQLINCKRY